MGELSFQFPLRKYQVDILEVVNEKIKNGEKEIHIVAPPGAGKTIIGLQLISKLQRPSLILCPNTTIQSQWGQKLNLFLPPDAASFGVGDLVGTHEDKPLKPITLLTYQVLSVPGREAEYLEKLARKEWIEELRSKRSVTRGDAETRLLELQQNNPKAYKQELARHMSRLRRNLVDKLDLKEVLHENALNLLQTLKRQKFGVVLFDECHHLTDYWAAIMGQLIKYLDDPMVIGLTGTPPEGKSSSQENRYLSLVGEIDYQVPTPALVKEGGLAPFQDLVYFTEPTEKEYAFLEEQHEDFHKLVAELTSNDSADSNSSAFTSWILQRIERQTSGDGHDATAKGFGANANLDANDADGDESEANRAKSEANEDENEANGAERNAGGEASSADKPNDGHTIAPQKVAEASHKYVPKVQKVGKNAHRIRFTEKDKEKQKDKTSQQAITNSAVTSWKLFAEAKPGLAQAFARFLWKNERPFPKDLEVSEATNQSPVLEDWMYLLEDYCSRNLKLSSSKQDHELYERIKSAARKLGYGFTEQGLRRQASPVDRVLALSNSKSQAVAKILDVEYRSLQDRVRSLIITDFEKMSATSVRSLEGILSEESGGAVDVLKTLLRTTAGEELNPCLVTGSHLIVDNRIANQFVAAAQDYVKTSELDLTIESSVNEQFGFSEITASGGTWESRLYVGMATEIFERGITKCLIGTRGLFGEGWDSQALNTLIDLTMSTSPVSVKQLRGRSIRLQSNDPLGARKCANNWDVVCIAPQLEKGLNDYHRFVRKHEGYFGIADDGQIESGVSHVHPSLSDLTPAEVFASIDDFNREMTDRALVRDKIYDLWKVGQPYKNKSLGCVEIGHLKPIATTPPFIRQNLPYQQHAAELRQSLNAVFQHGALIGVGASVGTVLLLHAPLLVALTSFLLFMSLAAKKYQSLYKQIESDMNKPSSQELAIRDIGTAVLEALKDRRLLRKSVTKESIKVSVRSDGSYRIFLDDVEPKQSAHFVQAVTQVLTPATNQPYVIPKYEYFVPALENSAEVSQSQDQFFKQYLQGKAEPRVAAYYPVPDLLARTEKGREAFEAAWNKYVSPGSVEATETKPELLDRYFKMAPSLAQRLLWE